MQRALDEAREAGGIVHGGELSCRNRRGERLLCASVALRDAGTDRPATATEGPFGALVHFLTLTSARRSEASAIRWDEIDAEGIWTLPVSRSKTKIEVFRPLSKAALAILDAQPRLDDCPFVFTARGVSPMTSFSMPKAKLDKISGVHDWRLHDLRRTARSLLPRAGVNADVAERCLGHAMPTIRATYDRHQYLDEMRHAFEALAALIERIVHPPKGDVIPLRGRR